MATKSKTPTKLLSIKEAAQHLGTTDTYVRTLVRKGKLATERENLNEDGTLWRHMIPITELESYKGNARTSRREDGRNKYVLYATPEELEALRKVIETEQLTCLIEKPKYGKPKKDSKPEPEAVSTDELLN